MQITPCVKTCVQTFDRASAEYVASKVQELTGAKGFIIEFDRKELEELNFKH